jgi:hypothetical protein
VPLTLIFTRLHIFGLRIFIFTYVSTDMLHVRSSSFANPLPSRCSPVALPLVCVMHRLLG